MDVLRLIKAGKVARELFRVWNQNRKARQPELSSELLPANGGDMQKQQVLQGKVTHSGLVITALSFLLDKLDLAVPGFDETTVAGVVVGLLLAVYGRVRREHRDDT